MLDKIFSKIERFVPAKWRWVLSHGGFKRYFANTGWMFGGQMLTLLLSFFIGAWLARYLGPENYGVMSYAVAFVGLFGFIMSLGVDGIVTRDLVKFPEKRDELLGTGFRLKLIGGVIAFILTCSAAFIFPLSPLIRFLIIIFAASFILQAINVISLFFQAEVQAKKNVGVNLVATLVSSGLKIAVIMSGRGVIWVILIFTLDFLWQGIGFLSAYRRSGLKIKDWRFNQPLAKEILSASWLLMLASASAYIYLKVDQVMIGAYLGTKEVGLYAAAVKLCEIWYFVPSIICASLFPAIVNAKITSPLIYKTRLKALYLLMIGLAVAIAIPSSLLASWLIRFIFGPAYLAAAGILQIYIWSGIGFFVYIAIYQYFLSENRLRAIFYFSLFSMLANIGLNLILIPRLGLLGAAWATFISYSAGPIVVALTHWRRRPAPPESAPPLAISPTVN
jgi:O-antigen/teichoic acid export membrane protein